MKISPSTHGALDYILVIALALSPSLLQLPPVSSTLVYTLSVVHLLMTLFTRFPYGIIKLIPFRFHGLVELIVGFAMIGVAFILGNQEGDLAKDFFLAFGFIVLLVWFLTDYSKSSK